MLGLHPLRRAQEEAPEVTLQGPQRAGCRPGRAAGPRVDEGHSPADPRAVTGGGVGHEEIAGVGVAVQEPERVHATELSAQFGRE